MKTTPLRSHTHILRSHNETNGESDVLQLWTHTLQWEVFNTNGNGVCCNDKERNCRSTRVHSCTTCIALNVLVDKTIFRPEPPKPNYRISDNSTEPQEQQPSPRSILTDEDFNRIKRQDENNCCRCVIV
jgi:hypothetical protein